MPLHSIHFTLEQARAELAAIRADLERMVALKLGLDERGRANLRKHEYFGGAGPNGQGAFPREMEEIVSILRDFDRRGIIVKGLESGLIDFPHFRSSGEEVYLCYQHGEPDIEFWHTIEGGFMARRSIKVL
jgi:hypothetical protein